MYFFCPSIFSQHFSLLRKVLPPHAHIPPNCAQVQHVFLQPHNKKHAAQRARLRFSCTDGDHLTLLNVYLAFIRHGRQSRWCAQNFLNYKSLCRAVEIRGQLLGYLKRFGLPLVSCDGDVDAVLRCLVAGCFANAARLGIDGK